MVYVLTLLPAVFFKFFKLWEEKREKGRFILSHIDNLFTAVCKVIIIMTGTFRKEMTSFF